MRSYGTARGIFSILEFIGWSVVVVGIIAGFFLAESAGRYVSDGQKFLLFLLGAGGSLIGLFVVGAVQSWRAGVDSAEYSQQMLKIARDQLDVSKQSLKRQEADRNSFAALRSTDEDAPRASFERKEPSVSSKTVRQEPGDHRGQKIFRVGDSYRAIGDIFANREEAVAAIDRKLDSTAIEAKPELPASMLLGTDLTQETNEQLSAEKARQAPRSYTEAEKPVKPGEPNFATATGRYLKDEEENGENPEPKPVMNTEPEPSKEERNLSSKIKEEGGKFRYGRMAFSSREAAEKYVRQLGVNPNYKS